MKSFLLPLYSVLALSLTFTGCKKDKDDPTPSTPAVAAPTVASLSPTSGMVGSSVTITGTNLTGATAVSFNGIAAPTFTVSSATSLTVTVPVGATTGNVTVTTPGGTSVGTAFTVTVPTKAEILTFAGRKWKIAADVTETYVGTTLTNTENNYASYDNCEKDDFYVFRADKTLTYDPTTVICGPGETVGNGTWDFSGDETKLFLTDSGFTLQFDLLQLDATTLKIQYSDNSTPGQIDKQTFTFTAF